MLCIRSGPFRPQSPQGLTRRVPGTPLVLLQARMGPGGTDDPRRTWGTPAHSTVVSLGGQAEVEQPNNEAVAVPIVERALDLGVNYC